MSTWFVSAAGADLWNPSNRVAEFFLRGIRSTEVFIERESGVGDIREDEVTVDAEALLLFFDAAQEQLSHPVMRAQANGLMALIVVLLRRCDSAPRIQRAWEQLESKAEIAAALMPH